MRERHIEKEIECVVQRRKGKDVDQNAKGGYGIKELGLMAGAMQIHRLHPHAVRMLSPNDLTRRAPAWNRIIIFANTQNFIIAEENKTDKN